MNKDIYNTMYNKAFKNNAASIILYKSGRKNSKCSDIISINHLISENIKISDDRILNQFTGTIEKIVYQSLKYNRYLELSVYIDHGKNSTYENANNDLYYTTEYLRFSFTRIKFSSIEQCINFIYDIYYLIYPYNELNLTTIHNNSSIRYLVNTYYNRK